MNWKEETINVGHIPELGMLRVVFHAKDDMPEIESINPGCRSCTEYKYLQDKKELHIGITLGQIPNHLVKQKTQVFKKSVTVKYKNATLDVLNITGIKTTL